MLKKMKRMYPHQSLMMVFIIGLMTIAGSFTVEHIFKVAPCEMCLWQRYLAITITSIAFTGTLFRGKIKKWFLAAISLTAAVSLALGIWQSLAQRDIVELPGACEAPVEVTTAANATQDSANLLANLQANNVNYVDCSKPEEGFFFYDLTGITLANLNVLLMTFITVFTFYKLFFKPRRRYRRYNNNRNGNTNRNNNRNSNSSNSNNRRYRGSGYRRSNNRSNNNSNGNRRYNNNSNPNAKPSNRKHNNEN